MVHPATKRAVAVAVSALGSPLDVGIVFPPKAGEARGPGLWSNRDLSTTDIMAMLPRAAAANSRGGNIFVRLGPAVKDRHPGIVMIDDVSIEAVDQLTRDGYQPCLVVETSPKNYQAWIRVIEHATVPYSTVGLAIRWLAQTYGGDERAVSPRQPGRLPGFTNRKDKHRQGNVFPFVKITRVEPGRVAANGSALLDKVSGLDTGRAAAGALPETPRPAARVVADIDREIAAWLDYTYERERLRIMREVRNGRRPAHAASASEVDFAVAIAALQAGIGLGTISEWIRSHRIDKGDDYGHRTTQAAAHWRGKGLSTAPKF